MNRTIVSGASEMGVDARVVHLLDDAMSERAAVGALLVHGEVSDALRLALRLMPRTYVLP